MVAEDDVGFGGEYEVNRDNTAVLENLAKEGPYVTLAIAYNDPRHDPSVQGAGVPRVYQAVGAYDPFASQGDDLVLIVGTCLIAGLDPQTVQFPFEAPNAVRIEIPKRTVVEYHNLADFLRR